MAQMPPIDPRPSTRPEYWKELKTFSVKKDLSLRQAVLNAGLTEKTWERCIKPDYVPCWESLIVIEAALCDLMTAKETSDAFLREPLLGVYENLSPRAYNRSPYTFSPGGILLADYCLQKAYSHYVDPERKQQTRSSPMRKGLATGYLVCSPSSFPSMFVKGSRQNDEDPEDGPIILCQDEWRDCQGMAKSINAHKGAAFLLSNAVQRNSCHFFKHPGTGITLKTRFDFVTSDGFIVDIRTSTKKIDKNTFTAIAAEFSYHVKVAMGFHAYRALTGTDASGYIHVVCEQQRPHIVATHGFEDPWLEKGNEIVDRAAAKIAKAIETGEWPGMDEGISSLPMPRRRSS